MKNVNTFTPDEMAIILHALKTASARYLSAAGKVKPEIYDAANVRAQLMKQHKNAQNLFNQICDNMEDSK